MMKPVRNYHHLYFWDMEVTKGVVGHVALKVTRPGDDIYISHWPGQQTIFKRLKGQRNQLSLFHDIIAEGNRNPEILKIPLDLLDPVQINMEDLEKSYNLLKWNCADVVCTALQTGLKSNELKQDVAKQFGGPIKIIPLTPKNLFLWVKEKIQDEYVSAQNSGPSPAIFTSAPLNPCAPLKPTANFSGRSTHLNNVYALLQSSEKALVVTAGTGGVGKTEFARKVAQELSPLFQGRVFWMDSETVESLQRCLVHLYLNLEAYHNLKPQSRHPVSVTMEMTTPEIKQLFQHVYSHFSDKGQNSLFIFDNANQFRPSPSPGPNSGTSSSSSSTENKSIFLISEFLPNSFPHANFRPFPSVLITSRSSDWSESKDFEMLNLENFTLEETIEYFQNTFKETTPKDEVEACKEKLELLHSRFDGYALGLTLAAGWIRGAGFSKQLEEGLKCYLQLFHRPSNNLLKRDANTNYRYNPHEIMEQTCAAIEEQNELALKLLKQMSFLSPDFLTVGDCEYLNLTEKYQVTWAEMHSALDTLAKFSVVSMPTNRYSSTSSIKIHRVIQLLVKGNQTQANVNVKGQGLWSRSNTGSGSGSRDGSILFEVCSRTLSDGGQNDKRPLAHLKSIMSSLEDFKSTLPFWYFLQRPQCSYYLTRLDRKFRDNLFHLLPVIQQKLRGSKPPIQPESVMDNSDFLQQSSKLYKIKYIDLAHFILQDVGKSRDSMWLYYLQHTLKILGFLEVWPQKEHVEKAVHWINSNFESEYASILVWLQHSNTTEKQQELKSYLKLKYEEDENNSSSSHNLNLPDVLQKRDNSDGDPVNLPDDLVAKVIWKQLENHSVPGPSNTDLAQLSKAIQASSKKEQLFYFVLLDFKSSSFARSVGATTKFQDIILLFLPHCQIFSQRHLDFLIEHVKVFFWLGTANGEYSIHIVKAISILSVFEGEAVIQACSGFCESMTANNFKGINVTSLEENWHPWLPYLKSFVTQNRDSENENVQKVLKEVVQLLQVTESNCESPYSDQPNESSQDDVKSA